MNRIEYDGSGELWISDIDTARFEDKSPFDRVITVCQDSIEDNVSDETEYSHYNMNDGPDNRWGGDPSFELFEEAASELSKALESGESVLIHCHVGKSRSTTVSMAALMDVAGLRRSDAYDLVERYRPQTNPGEHLRGHLREFSENIK